MLMCMICLMYNRISGIPTNGIYTYGYISVSVALPVVDDRGSCLLLVDAKFNVTLAGEVAALIQELSMDGYTVVLRYANATEPPITLRNWILNLYNTQVPTITSIYILGHVPVAYSGAFNPDVHAAHQGNNLYLTPLSELINCQTYHITFHFCGWFS
jgi:hypothetical protein